MLIGRLTASAFNDSSVYVSQALAEPHRVSCRVWLNNAWHCVFATVVMVFASSLRGILGGRRCS
jgi:hypothetical protein